MSYDSDSIFETSAGEDNKKLIFKDVISVPRTRRHAQLKTKLSELWAMLLGWRNRDVHSSVINPPLPNPRRYRVIVKLRVSGKSVFVWDNLIDIEV